jgi:hypothetical protein
LLFPQDPKKFGCLALNEALNIKKEIRWWWRREKTGIEKVLNRIYITLTTLGSHAFAN